MKHINTEKLVAELTKMQFTLNAAYRNPQSDNIVRAISLEYDDIFSLIESLQQEQQEESDKSLEEEYKDYVENDPVYSKLVNGIAGRGIAHHFYELGKNSK